MYLYHHLIVISIVMSYSLFLSSTLVGVGTSKIYVTHFVVTGMWRIL